VLVRDRCSVYSDKVGAKNSRFIGNVGMYYSFTAQNKIRQYNRRCYEFDKKKRWRVAIGEICWWRV